MIKTLLSVFLFCLLIPLQAQTWQPLGPIGSDHYSLKNSAWGGGTGQIHAFAFVPSAVDHSKSNWYCASPWGGLWRSADTGAHWQDINPQLEQVSGLCSAVDIAWRGTDIYVANGRINNANALDGPGVPSTGVFMSGDGGQTFQHTGLRFAAEDNRHIARLLANHYADRLQLFAATDQGLFTNQSDVTKKWTRVFDNDKLFTVDISSAFGRTHMIYASGDDIYVSKKEGAKGSFAPFEPSIGDQLPAAKGQRNIDIRVIERDGKEVIYALVYQDGQNFFLYYDGSKWELRKPPVASGVYIPTFDRLKISVDPIHPDRVYAGITYVCRTDDGGKTWQLGGEYCQPGSQQNALNIHGDIHAVDCIPGTEDVLIGTDGGVFRYFAKDKKDVELNTGLNISQVIGMSAPPQAPHRIMIGKQDTGADIYDGSEWTNYEGGDGFSIHASPVDSTLFVGNFGRYCRLKNGKIVSDRPSACKVGETALYSIVAYDPAQPERCYTAGTNLSYTDDGGKSFTTVYKYHSSDNQPVNFDTQIESMGVGHDRVTGESVIYLSNYGFYNGSVCQLARGRIQAPPHSDKPCSENLCNTCWVKIPLPHEKYEWLDKTSYSVSAIAVSPDDPDELWVCYDHAVYDHADLRVLHSTDGGASWLDMNKGLPPYVISSALQYDAKTKYLYLGTATGVFINRNDGDGWKTFGTALPRSYVKALEISPGIRKIRAGLYGRGVWEIDLAN